MGPSMNFGALVGASTNAEPSSKRPVKQSDEKDSFGDGRPHDSKEGGEEFFDIAARQSEDKNEAMTAKTRGTEEKPEPADNEMTRSTAKSLKGEMPGQSLVGPLNDWQEMAREMGEERLVKRGGEIQSLKGNIEGAAQPIAAKTATGDIGLEKPVSEHGAAKKETAETVRRAEDAAIGVDIKPGVEAAIKAEPRYARSEQTAKPQSTTTRIGDVKTVAKATAAGAAQPGFEALQQSLSALPEDLTTSNIEERESTFRRDPELRTTTRADAYRNGVLQPTAQFAAGAQTISSAASAVSSVGEGALGADVEPGFELQGNTRFSLQQTSLTQPMIGPSAANIAAAHGASVTAQLIAAVKSNARNDSVEIRLDPPELGRVKIDFAMETNEAVRAVITAERGETLDHLRRNIQDLSEQLKQAGFESIEFEFARQEGGDFSDIGGFETAGDGEEGAATSDGKKDIVYLSMRTDAQLDLLA